MVGSMGDLAHFRLASLSVARAVKGRSRGSPTVKGRHDPQVFFADYYDANCATTARQQLDGRTMFHTRLNVYPASDFDHLLDEDAEKEQPVQEQMPYPVMSYGSLNSSGGFFDLSSPPRSSVSLPTPDSPTPTRGGVPDDCKSIIYFILSLLIVTCVYSQDSLSNHELGRDDRLPRRVRAC